MSYCLIRNLFNSAKNRNLQKIALYSSSTNFTDVLVKDGIKNIILNDPKTRNSLSVNMMDSILRNIADSSENKDLRVIILSSTGPVFSAGHNLKELTGKEYDVQKSVFSKCSDLIAAIQNVPVPVIAKVDGICSAAGLQLAASCDLLVCSEKSNFSTPGANVGIFCSTPGIALARVLPKMKTSYMLFTGLPISAQEALKIGLVSSVVPSEKLDAECEKICDAIKSKSRSVIALGKKFFYRQIQMDQRSAYQEGAKVIVNTELSIYYVT